MLAAEQHLPIGHFKHGIWWDAAWDITPTAHEHDQAAKGMPGRAKIFEARSNGRILSDQNLKRQHAKLQSLVYKRVAMDLTGLRSSANGCPEPSQKSPLTPTGFAGRT